MKFEYSADQSQEHEFQLTHTGSANTWSAYITRDNVHAPDWDSLSAICASLSGTTELRLVESCIQPTFANAASDIFSDRRRVKTSREYFNEIRNKLIKEIDSLTPMNAAISGYELRLRAFLTESHKHDHFSQQTLNLYEKFLESISTYEISLMYDDYFDLYPKPDSETIPGIVSEVASNDPTVAARLLRTFANFKITSQMNHFRSDLPDRYVEALYYLVQASYDLSPNQPNLAIKMAVESCVKRTSESNMRDAKSIASNCILGGVALLDQSTSQIDISNTLIFAEYAAQMIFLSRLDLGTHPDICNFFLKFRDTETSRYRTLHELIANKGDCNDIRPEHRPS